MAIVVESTTETLVGANDSTPTFNMPSTRPNSDLYLMCFGCDGDASGGWTLTGWSTTSSIGASTNAEAHEGTVSAAIMGRIGSSEPASYTFGSGPSEEWVFYVLRLSGFDTSDNLDVVANGTGNSTTATAPTATPTTSGGLVVRLWAIDTDNPAYSSGPTGHTRRGSSSSSAGGAGSAYAGVATDDTTTTASVAEGTLVMPGTYDDNWAAITLVVNVSAGPAVTQPIWLRTGGVRGMRAGQNQNLGRTW